MENDKSKTPSSEEPEKDVVDVDEKNKKKQKKHKRVREREINLATKDMENLLNSVKDQLGNENVKIVKVVIPKPTFKYFVKEILFTLLLNTFMILGLNGLFSFAGYDNIGYLLLFCLYISAIEIVLKAILLIFFPTLTIRTLGLSNFIPIGVTLIFSIALPIFITYPNMGSAILSLILLFVVRNYIRQYITKTFTKIFKKKK